MKRLSGFALTRTRLAARWFAAKLRNAVKHPEDPEVIHDLRVSIRRYNQCLRTFEELLDHGAVKRTRQRLRKLMSLCGATRNCDVAQDVLRAAGVADGSSVFSQLQSARTEAEQAMVRQLSKKRWKSYAMKNPVKLVESGSSHGRWQPTESVAANAAQALPEICRDFFKAGAAAFTAKDNLETLHKFRIRAKRFRYTLEIFQQVYGDGIERKLKEMRALQDHLGAINDCVITINLIGNTADIQPLVAELLARREAEFQRFWTRRFAGRKVSHWIHLLSTPKLQ
jgi:CHAD domain-containing protein